jgi:cobalamin biosynthesis protein CobD/CbiB
MDEPLESRLRQFRETRSYESLLWAARAAIGLPVASVVLPLLFSMFPEPVPIAWVVAILAINWFIALLAAVHGIRGLLDFQRAGQQGRRETRKAVAPMIKRDLFDLSR